jgi:hypothetical protein
VGSRAGATHNLRPTVKVGLKEFIGSD